MSTDTTNKYLRKLQIDKKFGNTFVGKYLTNIRLVSLIIISIVILGIVSFITLPRRLNPEVKIPLIIVNTILPGAPPQDIESLVTIPLEDTLESLENVSTITSSSQENVSTISIEFDSSVDPKDARLDVQAAVDTASDLPEDSFDPKVIELDFENQPVWSFAVTTTDDLASLMRFSEELQVLLEDHPSIREVSISGLDEQEVQISINSEKLDQYSLSPIILKDAISKSLSSFPAGSITSQANSFNITIDPQVTSIEDLRLLNINLNGQVVPLSDIADVYFKSKPDQAPAFLTKSGTTTNAVTMSVFKTSGSDINTSQQDAAEIVDSYSQEKTNFFITDIENTAADIDDQFQELGSNFATTILLVFVTLLLFLGLRQALVASISIPLTFLISFVIMQFIGISLNFLSLFSLLLALGLVVDDAIVIISAMTTYHKSGKFTPTQTGHLVWKDFIVPIWSTTITTVWAFIPLLLASGVIGEFIKSIPVVVTATLLSSTTVAVLINLPLMIVILQPKVARRVKIAAGLVLALTIITLIYLLTPDSPLRLPTMLLFIGFLFLLYKFGSYLLDQIKSHKKVKTANKKIPSKMIKTVLNQGFINISGLEKKYNSSLTSILSSSRKRKLTIIFVVVFALFSYILVPAGFVQNEFFPKMESDRIYLEAETPNGTNNPSLITESQTVSQAYLNDLEDIDYYTTQIGSRAPSFDSAGSNPNYILFTLNLVSDQERQQSSIELASKLRNEIQNYSGLSDLSVIEQSGGPPVGADLQIKLLGDDLDTLNQEAQEVVAYMETIPGLTNIQTSIKPGISKIVFNPDYAKLTENQISTDQIGLSLRMYVNGFTYDDIKIDDHNYDITYRSADTLQTTDSINQLQLPSPFGPTPLSSLGNFELEPNPTLITREDGQRTISISASVVGDTPAPAINARLEEFADTDLDLPPGYSWKTGGANEENQSSVNSILQAMIIAALLILITMVVQLQSFRQALIVLLVIPLATSGVFVIFALTGTALSFPALIGVLALFGIVVNNSIMIVEKINQNLNIGLKLKDSVVDASTSRLEPILLSSLTTIMGLLPITISDPLWRGLGGAIIAGLTVSGVIMLVFIPTVYYAVYRKEYK